MQANAVIPLCAAHTHTAFADQANQPTVDRPSMQALVATTRQAQSQYCGVKPYAKQVL